MKTILSYCELGSSVINAFTCPRTIGITELPQTVINVAQSADIVGYADERVAAFCVLKRGKEDDAWGRSRGIRLGLSERNRASEIYLLYIN